MNILHIDSSPLEGRSVSRELSARVVAGLRKRIPDATVTRRDVATDPPPHADAEIIDIVRYKKDEDLSPRQLRERALADTLIAELQTADVLVIGSPMYNYTVSTQLKAWLDRVCQSGRTFRYTPGGSVGLLAPGKRAIIAISRGGNYTNGKQNHRDFQTPYLKEILGFVGITDVAFVIAEGVNISPEERARVIERATREIDTILDNLAATQGHPQTELRR
jgi:FMN-dependent NADH-azoreductase